MPKIISVYNNYFRDFKTNLNITLEKVGIDTSLVEHHFSNVGIADFGSESFRKLTTEKISIIQKELEVSDRVLFLDNDIYLLKNPIDYFENYIEDAEIIFQDDVNEFEHEGKKYPVVNTGVIYIKSTDQTHTLFDPNSDHIRNMGSQENDQTVINRRLLDLGVKFKVLPKELFPCGRVWYGGEADPSPYLIHYNWVAGKKTKLAKMRQYGHWHVSKIASVVAFVLGKVQSIMGW